MLTDSMKIPQQVRLEGVDGTSGTEQLKVKQQPSILSVSSVCQITSNPEELQATACPGAAYLQSWCH